MKLNFFYYEDFVFWLKSNNYYERYKSNVEKSHSDPLTIFQRNAKKKRTIKSVLMQSFDWADTPEGWKYWNDCLDRLVRDTIDRPLK